jgi:ATP-dependent metalloprotease
VKSNFLSGVTGISPLRFYGQGDLLFGPLSPLDQQKRLFFNRAGKTIQNLQSQLNAQPHNSALFLQLLRELNRNKDYAKVRSLVESGRYPLSDDQVVSEYLKAAAKLNVLDQINVKELLRVQAASGFMGHIPQQQQPLQYTYPNVDYSNQLGGGFSNPHNNNSNGGYQQHQQQQSSNAPPPIPIIPRININPDEPLTVRIHQSRIYAWVQGLGTLAFLALGVTALYLLFARNEEQEKKGSSNNAFPISPAHSQVKNLNVKFKDVKGCDEVKEELIEVVEFLKNPNKFTQLGAKLPKGVLLSGPPGTGKTLLARAIAGEAGVSFLYCSGSSFDELYVGVGPRRVRALFEDAKKQAPCIIFIDEIDAVGVKRSKFSMSYSKESTLNQLLTEMDGFNQTSGIVVIGATNFPEALDSALTRPGRFDKIVTVPLPDLKGRKDIIDLYLNKTVPGPDVDSKTLARGTIGFSGAELANLINIAAIKASMQNKAHIDMRVLEEAKDDVLMGIKRTTEQTFEDRRLTAYHEGGHALVALHTQGARPLHKATIISRGGSLGVTVSLPERDEVSMTRKQMLAALAVSMGGRAAEELMFGEEEVTSGASSDIRKATDLATSMVTKWGMSEKVGKVYHSMSAESSRMSQAEMNLIDSEVKDLLEERYQYAKHILKTHEEELHLLADALLKYETLSGDEIKTVIRGKRLERDL